MTLNLASNGIIYKACHNTIKITAEREKRMSKGMSPFVILFL